MSEVIEFVDPPSPETMLFPVAPGVCPQFKTVQLNILKLDAVWKLDPHTYVGTGGYDVKETKLRKIREHLDAGLPIEKPIIDSPSGEPGRFEFVDGRHRVAVFRERGLVRCPFVVPAHLANVFLARFG